MIAFQRMSVKGNVFNYRKIRYEENDRFRNCNITQYLTSVDIKKVVKTGGNIVEFHEGFVFNN